VTVTSAGVAIFGSPDIVESFTFAGTYTSGLTG
jgi:hypothetical protein